ncbi:MAG: RNA-binding cell elongation regulator Jag/EloR [Desulfobacterales bacterium]|jgi:spoIIIJ-associated protein
MTSLLEFEGKNVDKAVEKACEELDIALDELSYDVLSYGSSGIFGLAGTKKARIRVIMPDASEESVIDSDQMHSEVGISDDSESNSEDAIDENYSADQQVYTFPDEPSDLGRTVLRRIVDSITTDAKISVDENSERILFNVVGGNAAILIGKKGQTLEAIQSLVEKIVNKHNNNNKIRIQVDVEGYLETRKVNLEKLATRLADKSKRIRKPISLGQMSAHDRRIIHLALKDDPEVKTKSRGEGYMRKLVIFPKKHNSQRHKYH